METDTDKLRSDLLDLVESLKGKKILTGTIQGVERLADNPEMSYAVTYHGFRASLGASAFVRLAFSAFRKFQVSLGRF